MVVNTINNNPSPLSVFRYGFRTEERNAENRKIKCTKVKNIISTSNLIF